MLTVACLYWKGDFRGREKIYNSDWVLKLKNMVERNLSIPHNFVCLTNTQVPTDSIQLENDWPGWWNKIELFRPGLFKDRVLYLDLDVLIMQNLLPFVTFDSKFKIIGTGFGQKFIKEGKTVIRRYNSSVMVFDVCSETNHLYRYFADRDSHWIDTFRGDQDYLGYYFEDLSFFPKNWITKLRHLNGGFPNSNTKILLCMNGNLGKNDKASEMYPWVKEIWQ